MSEEFNYQVECGECGETLPLNEFETHACVENEVAKETQKSELIHTEAVEESSVSASDNNFIGKLAEAVQARPPLWDHTLPLRQRGKDIREVLWKEIHQELEGKLSLENLIKKWTNLRDTFLKHLKTYTPSGSGTNDKKRWKYYDHFLFLAGKNLPKATLSNITDPGNNNPDFMLANSNSSKSVTPDLSTPTPKRRKEIREDAEEMLLKVLKEPPLPIFPSQPQLSPALTTVQSVLDKLPAERRMRLELQFINQVYSEYAQYVKNE